MIAADSADLPETDFDIMDPAVAADPWPHLRALREAGPVVRHGGYGRWLITTDRATRKVLTNFRQFSVRGTSLETLFGSDSFIAMDDRHGHDSLRNVWAYAFRPSGVAGLRARVGDIVAELLAPLKERLLAGESVDLSDQFCRALPTTVIGRMMGVPDEVLPLIVEWSDAMVAGGTAYHLSPAQAEALHRSREEAKTSLADYLKSQIDYRRRHPGEDLISAIAVSDVARGMSDDQIVPNLRQLFFAGNETTARWLGHIIVTLGERAELQREVAEDRGLVVQANDEVLRWQGVIGTTPRKVWGGPVVLEGVELPEGAELTCLTTAANRDPVRYADPDTLDIHRPYQPSLAFGMGFHVCLGQALAKMEAESAVNALLDLARPFHVAAPYTYSTLPVRGPGPVTIALN